MPSNQLGKEQETEDRQTNESFMITAMKYTYAYIDVTSFYTNWKTTIRLQSQEYDRLCHQASTFSVHTSIKSLVSDK